MVSDIGTWVQLVVVGSLVAAGTGSAVRTGLVALATFMPQGISSPIGGLLADRFDRRTVFATVLSVQAALTGLLAVVLGLGVRDPSILTVLILFGSAAGALGQPSYMAMLPDLVPPEELTAVVSLGAYSWNSGRVIGPLVGTALAAASGPAWTVGFNALTFVAMAVAVLMVRHRFVPLAGADAGAGVVERLVDGFRAVRQSTSCSFTITLLVAFNITMVPFMGMVPIYAAAEFDGGTGLTGLISSVQGIGAIIGGVTLTMMVARRRRSDLLVGVTVLCAFTMTAYALAPNRVAMIVAVAFLGATMSGFFISTSTVIQRDAPREHRGRIIATMQASMGVSYGLGLLFIGAIGDLVNLRVAFLVGTACMAGLFWWIAHSTVGWRDAIDGEHHLDDLDRILPAR